MIYSVFKAGKKVVKNRPTIEGQSLPKESTEQSPTTVQPPTASPLPQQDFKKMLEDLLGGAPEEKNPEPKAFQPKQQPIALKPLRKESVGQPTKIVTQSAKKEKIVLPHATAKNHKEEIKLTKEKTAKISTEPVVMEETGFNFDIREAIIYSEIMKRPEY